jgi:hypothetical protein
MDVSIFQDIVTLEGDVADQEVYQDDEGIVDTHGFRTFELCTELWANTNVVITVESTNMLGGKWNTAATIAAAGLTYIQAEEGATNKLERYVRWKVKSNGINWAVCFRMTYSLKP